MNPVLISSILWATRCARFLAGVILTLLLGRIDVSAQQVNAAAMSQIESLLAEKAARTPAQQKMDSQLVYFAKQSRHQAISAAVPALEVSVELDKYSSVLVDIKATVSADLLAFIAQSGGKVASDYPQYKAIRASLPIDAIEALAARDDVRWVEPAAEMTTNTGPVLSEGDRTHRADTARATYPTKGGSGIKIGVLSDGVNSLATSIANGELNADTAVIAGQAGSGNEGTAMMEIVQDLVPNAKIYFATAFSGTAGFAANIIALKDAGCTVIVDDVTYFNESPFQDQVISQAVNTVSAAGVMYFSSARNSGSLDFGNTYTFGGGGGTSGTWEGDFLDGGAATIGGKAGSVHNFGTVGSPVTANIVAAGNPYAGSSGRVDFFWSDPNGASSNDYDLFVLSAADAVVRSSTNLQSGTQDPYEAVSSLAIGEKVVIVKTTAAAARFLHLDVGRRYLTVGTAGNVRGHNAAGAANAFSVAAAAVTSAPSSATPPYFTGGATNPVEYFSSDGPRRIFYTPGGTAITPGNVSSTGGSVLLKPDFTAADGGATSVPGFTAFYGTSAAAPHAAAIAALIKSYNPALTPAQVRTLLSSTALDIGTAGYDRTTGSGIIMALQAIQAAAAPDPMTVTGSFLDATGYVGGPFNPSSTIYTLTNNSGASLNWTATKTQAWVTLSSAGGTLAAGASTPVTVSLNVGANAFALGNYSDTVTFTNTTSAVVQTRGLTVAVVPTPPPPPANDNFANAITLTGISASGSATTTYATRETGEPSHAGNVGGHSVWWKWVAPGSSTVVVNTVGSNFDTLLGVYTGSSVNALTTIASNDDGLGIGVQSSLSFTAVAGTTYRIAVDGWGGATGSVVLNLTYTAINDFTADGKADILWENTTTGERYLWLMNGTAYGSGLSFGIIPTVWRIAATADFNTDSKTDILWENTSTGERYLWLMNGTAYGSGLSFGVIPTVWRITTAADFNGDGKADILWENTSTGQRYLWLMNGTAYGSGVDFGVITTVWRIAAAADFNSDGKPDILWENTSTGQHYLWLMNGTAYGSGVPLATIATTWRIATAADFNGDGNVDILWENTSTGSRTLWLMTGTAHTGTLNWGVIPTVWRITN